MLLTETHHAAILVEFYKELMSVCGEARGYDVFMTAGRSYGSRRGRRMALRAMRDGNPLDTTSYFAYGELLCTEGGYAGELYEAFPGVVHEHQEEDDFLVKFIETIACHGCTLKDVETLFAQYSDQVFEGSYAGDDFDYLFYFRDNKPNDYRCCITFEGRHVIYHRFTPEDYVDYDFGEVIPVKGE